MTVHDAGSCGYCAMKKIVILLTPTEAQILWRSLRADNLVANKLKHLLSEKLGLQKLKEGKK